MDQALVGEEKQIGVGRGVDQLANHVVVRHFSGLHAPTATGLRPVCGGGYRFHITRLGNRDDQLVIGDQILETQVSLVRNQPRAPVFPVLLFDSDQLFADDCPTLLGISKDPHQLGYHPVEFSEFATEFVDFKRRQPT